MTRAFLHDDLGELSAHARAHQQTKVIVHVLSQLRAMICAAEDRSNPNLTKVYEVSEQLVGDDVQHLVELLVECPVERVDKLIYRLKGSDRAKSQFRALLALKGPDQPPGVDLKLLYRAQFMAAYLALQYGLSR